MKNKLKHPLFLSQRYTGTHQNKSRLLLLSPFNVIQGKRASEREGGGREKGGGRERERGKRERHRDRERERERERERDL